MTHDAGDVKMAMLMLNINGVVDRAGDWWSDPDKRTTVRGLLADYARYVSGSEAFVLEWFTECNCGLVDRHADEALMYAALGLGGECGEVLEPIKKSMRTTNPRPLDRNEMISELGDVMFYVAAIANQLNISLEEIVAANIAKRQERGLTTNMEDEPE